GSPPDTTRCARCAGDTASHAGRDAARARAPSHATGRAPGRRAPSTRTARPYGRSRHRPAPGRRARRPSKATWAAATNRPTGNKGSETHGLGWGLVQGQPARAPALAPARELAIQVLSHCVSFDHVVAPNPQTASRRTRDHADARSAWARRAGRVA